MTGKLQIVYKSSEESKEEIHHLYKDEAYAMKDIGITIGIKPVSQAECLIFRGFSMLKEADYPKDKRFIQGFEEHINFLFLSKYYSYIQDLTIETFFVEKLEDKLSDLIKKKGWVKAFIKKEITALEHIEEGKSVWPDTSFEEMNKHFEKYEFEGKFGIRKYISKEIIDQEERYWVLNGNIYHRHNKIPDVVKEAAKRLNKLGSSYYTIDATPDFVVEVNPGESSDRHAVNSAEMFARWFKKEFA
jgi:hypothetical protein